MKNSFLILVLSFLCFSVTAQEEEGGEDIQDQLETIAATSDDAQDESMLEDLEKWKDHPLNLNRAGEEEIEQLPFLNEIEVSAFLRYRKLFGSLISVYELQAVPAWRPEMIRKILPYIAIRDENDAKSNWKNVLTRGEYKLLVRTGFSPGGGDNQVNYTGSNYKALMRYSYRFKNTLQYGFLGDKDAGEPFFRGSQRAGFDFYSFHLAIKKQGIIKLLSVGDFTVNMGQGLMQWQRTGIKKTAAIMNIEKAGPVIKPYTATSESNFQRGVGVILHKDNWELAAFASSQPVSANVATDSSSQQVYITSFLTSGYHRTIEEIMKKNNTRRTSAGTSVSYTRNRLNITWNSVSLRYSHNVKKQSEPYNLFADSGRTLFNSGVSYAFGYNNVHLFGEMACDKEFHPAFIQGVLLTLDTKADFSFLFRKIDRQYHAVAGNAFTENSQPTNETGYYTGISLHPSPVVALNAYADFFSSPWLKYRADAPSMGKELLAELTFTPGKQASFYARYKTSVSVMNDASGIAPLHDLLTVNRRALRLHAEMKISEWVTIKNRCELSWYHTGNNKEEGYLIYTDVSIKPMLQPWSAAIRVQAFETGSYNSRIYAYENTLPYAFSITAFSGEGYRFSVRGNYQLPPNWIPSKQSAARLSFQFATTVTRNKTENKSGLMNQANVQLTLQKNPGN